MADGAQLARLALRINNLESLRLHGWCHHKSIRCLDATDIQKFSDDYEQWVELAQRSGGPAIKTAAVSRLARAYVIQRDQGRGPAMIWLLENG